VSNTEGSWGVIDKLLHGTSQFFYKQAQMRFVSSSAGFILLINNDLNFSSAEFQASHKEYNL